MIHFINLFCEFELFGLNSFKVIKVEETTFSMLGTKMEIHMPKAEPGSWADLSVSEVVDQPANGAPIPGSTSTTQPTAAPAAETPASEESTVDALDLDDLELVPMKVTLSAEASGGRTDAQII